MARVATGLMLGCMSHTCCDLDCYADLDEVYRDNVVPLYRLMYAKVGNRPDAEDLTSEVFLAAMGPLRVTAHRAEVRAYLFACARTVLARFWRRRVGAQVTTMDVADAAFEQAVSMSDDPPRVRALLAPLSGRYRRILELRFLESFSIKDAASAMGVSVANAKVLQHRALAMAAEASGLVE